MTSKEFETLIEQYKDEIKESGFERPLTDDEINNISSNVNDIPDEYAEAFQASENREFFKFEELPHLLRNYLGAMELRKLRSECGENLSLEDENVRRYLDKNLMNAALRAGISAEKNSESTKDVAIALDTYMNASLMKKTMSPISNDSREHVVGNYGEEIASDKIEKNMAKQLVLAKAMLLAQIGKYDLINKNTTNQELDVPLSETFAHGNRTNFVLPAGENSGLVINAFMGNDGGVGADIEKRTAATHSVKLRKLGKSGAISSETKELRTYNPFRVFGNQYGMNIAVGGLGELGPDKKRILGEGESGHVYMRAESGDAKHCGSLLIGIEGSAPGKDNYLGHSHGILATKAKQSAFLADKNVPGKKVGGRQIDLSGISAQNLANLLNTFSEKYSDLQHNADAPEVRQKLDNINDMLMGKRMDINKIMDMFASLGIADNDLKDIVTDARQGYLSQVKANEITRDEFTQSIRKGLSQEKACNIAIARFEYAGNDLKLAAGAIKELIFTHETRSLGWKILHPIKNYRENATISSLLDKLETEKGFDKAQIVSAFGYHDDTFSFDWGKDLSYDKDVARFQRVNQREFKESDNKLFGVIQNVYSKLSKSMATSAEEEVKEMQEELRKIQHNEDLESSRESIVIEEEDELNKSIDADLIEDIIPEQPTITTQKNL